MADFVPKGGHVIRHIHAGVLFAVAVAAVMILVNFLVRQWVTKNPDSPAAQAAAFVV